MKNFNDLSDPSFETLPNGVIQMIFSWRSNREKVGLQRVSHLWRSLNNSLLNDIKAVVNEEYPFLVKGKKLSDSDYVEIFERQDAIYTQLAKSCSMYPSDNQLSRSDLSRASLRGFFTSLSPGNRNFTRYQEKKVKTFSNCK